VTKKSWTKQKVLTTFHGETAEKKQTQKGENSREHEGIWLDRKEKMEKHDYNMILGWVFVTGKKSRPMQPGSGFQKCTVFKGKGGQKTLETKGHDQMIRKSN